MRALPYWQDGIPGPQAVGEGGEERARRASKRIDVFRRKVRVARGSVPQLSRRWPRRACRAEWKHDVLVVHCGWAMTSAYPIAVRFAEDVIEPAQPTARVGVGP